MATEKITALLGSRIFSFPWQFLLSQCVGGPLARRFLILNSSLFKKRVGRLYLYMSTHFNLCIMYPLNSHSSSILAVKTLSGFRFDSIKIAQYRQARNLVIIQQIYFHNEDSHNRQHKFRGTSLECFKHDFPLLCEFISTPICIIEVVFPLNGNR